jgi:hypothetical protein
MGRTKTQRKTRDFSMTLVIKTHQNNNKKHRNFFEERPGPINLFWEGTSIIIIFYSLKSPFKEMGGHAPAGSRLLPSLLFNSPIIPSQKMKLSYLTQILQFEILASHPKHSRV